MMAKASSICWYDQVLKKENVLIKALKFAVNGYRGRGQPKLTWTCQIADEMREKWTGKEGHTQLS